MEYIADYGAGVSGDHFPRRTAFVSSGQQYAADSIYRRFIYIRYLCMCDGIGDGYAGCSIHGIWEGYTAHINPDRRTRGDCVFGIILFPAAPEDRTQRKSDDSGGLWSAAAWRYCKAGKENNHRYACGRRRRSVFVRIMFCAGVWSNTGNLLLGFSCGVGVL